MDSFTSLPLPTSSTEVSFSEMLRSNELHVCIDADRNEWIVLALFFTLPASIRLLPPPSVHFFTLNPEDGSDMFIRNVKILALQPNYHTLHSHLYENFGSNMKLSRQDFSSNPRDGLC